MSQQLPKYIYATVVAPVGISDLSNETLGKIVITSNPIGTSLKSTSIATVSGMQLAQNGTATVAYFSVTDYNNTTFDITLPTSNIKLSKGNNNMVASNFSSNYSLASSLTAGKKEFTIGAELYIPENRVANNYNTQNPFPVTLNYN